MSLDFFKPTFTEDQQRWIDDLELPQHSRIKALQTSLTTHAPDWWPYGQYPIDKSSPVFKDFWTKLDSLNSLLQELFGSIFPTEEMWKLAALMTNLEKPRFELGPGERDSGRQSEVISSLKKAQSYLEKARKVLEELPYPLDVQISSLKSLPQIEATFSDLSRLERFYVRQKQQIQGRGNERAIWLARCLRAGFERYSEVPCRISKDSSSCMVVSDFGLALSRVYQHLGLATDAYEPARKAIFESDNFDYFSIHIILDDKNVVITE